MNTVKYVKKSITIPEHILETLQREADLMGSRLSPLICTAVDGMLFPGSFSFMPWQGRGGLTGYIMEYGGVIVIYADKQGVYERYALLNKDRFLATHAISKGVWICRGDR